jgi:hypothetical protein
MTPEAWVAHYALWMLAAVAAAWLIRRSAARAAGYQAEAFAGLEAGRTALARFAAGIEGRAADRAAASGTQLDALLAAPGPGEGVVGFVIHVSLPPDASPADVSAVLARALESLRPLAETARTVTGEPLPVRIDAPLVGP